jgi:hypothetical protein
MSVALEKFGNAPNFVGDDIVFDEMVLQNSDGTSVDVADISSVQMKYTTPSASATVAGTIGSTGVGGTIPSAAVTAAGTYRAQFIVTFTDASVRKTEVAEVEVFDSL